MMQPFGVILAGGQARRMGGGDKGRMILGRRTLFSRVIQRFAPQVDQLILNANNNPAGYADLGLKVVPDNIQGHAGPLAGILASLDWAAAAGGQMVVSVAADTPFFPHDLVPRLLLASEGMTHPLALAGTMQDGRLQRHPTFGLWPVALRQDLRAALDGGLRKIVAWSDRHDGRCAIFPCAGFDPFFNINTPEDLKMAETML